MRTGDTKSLNQGGSSINPATEEKQDSLISAVAGTTTENLEAHFEADGNNRLKYKGEKDIAVSVIVKGNVATAGTESLELGIRHYDDSASAFVADTVDEDPTETALKILGDRRGKFTLAGVVTLSTDDYIELHVKNVSNTNNPTVMLKTKLLISERV